MATEYLKPVEDGYVRVYTYETCDDDEQWICNGFNWTTAEALIEYLAQYPKYRGGLKILVKDILIDDLKRRPGMPFVSDYVREGLEYYEQTA